MDEAVAALGGESRDRRGMNWNPLRTGRVGVGVCTDDASVEGDDERDATAVDEADDEWDVETSGDGPK